MSNTRKSVLVSPNLQEKQKTKAATPLRSKVQRPAKDTKAVSPRAGNVIRTGDRERYSGVVRGRLPADQRRYADARTRDGRTTYRGRRARSDYRRGYWDAYGYGYHSGYRHGYRYGYYDSFYDPYYFGYCFGSCYRHYHYYGPSLILGWHYGGFGFYRSRWHFTLVIGEPVLVSHHHHHYRYSWWDGQYANLYTWDRAMEVHPAEYTFAAGSCVELWIRTTDGTDYEIRIDPRYYEANDPGDLYALLWTELETEGQLQIEDVNGAVHVFPAGMIQQIEARACN